MHLDTVLRGGRLVDPWTGTDAVRDVAIHEGVVIEVAERIDEPRARTHGLEGCIVCPGLIDFHTHVYWGGKWGVDPDVVGPPECVTTVVDFGTSGPGNFAGFLEHVIRRSATRIYAFLHIAANGLYGAISSPETLRIVGELEDLRLALTEEAVEVATRHPDVIKGIKVRASLEAAGGNGAQAVGLARKAARMARLPVAAHIGRPPALAEEVLEQLEEGDVLTHCFRGPANSLLDAGGGVLPEAKAARERGVLFDVGHGQGSFSFGAARRLLEQGFRPHIISSDTHAYSLRSGNASLPLVLSKFLALGLSVPEAVRGATSAPAAVLGQAGELGALAPGCPADVAVLRLEEGRFSFTDTNGESLEGRARLEPVMTFRAGVRVWPADGR